MKEADDTKSLASCSTTTSNFRSKSAEDYFHIFLIAGLCVLLLIAAIVSSIFLFVDVQFMRAEFKADMEEFGDLTDQAWSDLMLIKPRKLESPFLVGVRVKRQGYDSNPYDTPVSNQPQVATPAAPQQQQQCQCGKVSANCPIGPDGPQGERGEAGQPGEPGRPGNQGAEGEEMVFEDIRPPCIRCPMGRPGDRGNPGARGRAGEDGEDGKDGVNGRDGQDGNQGCKGDAGPRGPPGPRGDRGPPGEDGVYGRGKSGPKGPLGEAGPQGTKGVLGSYGKSGAKGPFGPEGPPGEPGFAGEDGIAGPPGQPGGDADDAEYCPCPDRYTGKHHDTFVNPVIPFPPGYSKRKLIVSSVVKAKAA